MKNSKSYKRRYARRLERILRRNRFQRIPSEGRGVFLSNLLQAWRWNRRWTDLKHAMPHFVYRLTFEDGRQYVGSTHLDVEDRILEHKQNKQSRIYKRLNSEMNFKSEILHAGDLREQAFVLENREILRLEHPLNSCVVRVEGEDFCMYQFRGGKELRALARYIEQTGGL